MKPGAKFCGKCGKRFSWSFFSEHCSSGFQKLLSHALHHRPFVSIQISAKCTLLWHIPGVTQNLEHQPLKPQFCPGLLIRAILENPATRPDPIGVIIGSETRKRAHFGIFKTGVFCPFKSGHGQTHYAQKRCPPNCNEVPWKAF
jgi:hypothetical protein